MKTLKSTTTSKRFISPYRILASSLRVPDGRWFVLHDRKLKRSLLRRAFKGNLHWSSVPGGDSCKSFENVSVLCKKIERAERGREAFQGILVVGGGSVGDLGAFVASIYRRGIRLIHVPTTHLSAVDSAFGGKCGINFESAKNQIGTFYPAEMVFIIRALLPRSRSHILDGFAEIFKMALLERSLWKSLRKASGASAGHFWRLLPRSIEGKLRHVALDPFERKGMRRRLNLGHSLGHVFERLGPLSHGEAVALGIYFELKYFQQRGWISLPRWREIEREWNRFFDRKVLLKKLGTHGSCEFLGLLLRDKKRSGRFVEAPLVVAPGRVRLQKVEPHKLMVFLRREGILRA